MEDTITITVKEHQSLLEDRAWLTDLENAGVDNWEGYDFAHQLRRERLDEKEVA